MVSLSNHCPTGRGHWTAIILDAAEKSIISSSLLDRYLPRRACRTVAGTAGTRYSTQGGIEIEQIIGIKCLPRRAATRRRWHGGKDGNVQQQDLAGQMEISYESILQLDEHGYARSGVVFRRAS